MAKSLFITFEGIEGSGKTTQIRLLNDWLTQKKIKTVLTREPGGTPLADKIREILLTPEHKHITPLCELLLYTASRAEHIATVIKPALLRHKTVLCDRFMDATLAYQGYARGFPLKTIHELNSLVSENIKPHLTFLLDLKAEQGLFRALGRNAVCLTSNREARFEYEPEVFHTKVREGYLDLAKKEASRFCVLDATLSEQHIHQQIIKRLENIL
ncbi:MAG: dTMP kinase [Deltaproteobacteria bacterium RIFCSPLOWO2_12_FULL_40_28]|nr:MAG: dTMP kinase [Deltaproteobacteria bacterium RIFCSPHIGHO2_02_FULL_40_28]OGQ20674.1 MAG: dTMP kinase [Deltaproteobacteria bacterium RIFCSPHIGHO2_12_FULL_40_32]OGQ38909.1 MAG: dTMP kinase [Deltaproteobacteria bacterium RIFCSPLOWO2_02_FULL_40_36]OGQ55269.1 MAG: dTMP kinase [Deltaproteobacteria bacterium RIFCSPLOWO2_12_FULL_40_28]